jgi:hypothetical protein
MFLNSRALSARQREAEHARRNRAEIVKARSLGQMSRRNLIKAGIFTAGGLLAARNGLGPFATSVFASVPTGMPLSPFPRRDAQGRIVDQAFVQPLLRLHNLTTYPLTSTGGSEARLVWPATLGEVDALRRANTELIPNNLPFFDPGFGTPNFPNNSNDTNGGFGRQEPAIHNHSGHNGSENDRAQNAHFSRASTTTITTA